jgi:Icc-related predicted phosphoesterase
MIVAATGDIHHPTHTGLLDSSLLTLEAEPDLFLIAGDVLKPRDPVDYGKVIVSIETRVSCPIVAAFGNTEFQEDRSSLREENPSVIFLDDEARNLDLGGRDVLVVGSTGSLERPTSWQKRNIPHVNDIYRARIRTIAKLLAGHGELKILLTHYAPTYLTLEGEVRSSFPWMGTRRLESVISEAEPSAVVHAHAHRGTPGANINGVPIFNVSLPLNREIVVFELA